MSTSLECHGSSLRSDFSRAFYVKYIKMGFNRVNNKTLHFALVFTVL